MRSVRVVLLVCTALIGATACAGTQKVAPPVAAAPARVPVDVDGLVRQGCFRCLEKAFEAAQGPQVFEIAVLLTLRAKELGLPWAHYRERAATLAALDPAFATYLKAVDAIAPDPLSGERYLAGNAADATRVLGGPGGPTRLPPMTERLTAWREALRTGPGSEPFRRYMDIALTCSVAMRGGEAAAVSAPSEDDPPLVIYRVGLCGQHAATLRALRERHPDFPDADLALGRYALGANPVDLDEALKHLQSARDAFPLSAAVATMLGSVREQREEWAEALAQFEDVLQRAPGHRDALLGRTTSLSRLRRHEEAIESATRMIDLGAWFIGEAHYWRAWNRFSLQRYAEARTDADRAKSLMVNAAVFVLSGLIEWNERRLPTAESEFEEALKMDFDRCDAAQYLGRVRAQRGKVPEALAAFQQAIQCFDLSITVRRKLLADIQAGPGSEATRARLAHGHERAIADAIEDRDECRQNISALEKPGTQ